MKVAGRVAVFVEEREHGGGDVGVELFGTFGA